MLNLKPGLHIHQLKKSIKTKLPQPYHRDFTFLINELYTDNEILDTTKVYNQYKTNTDKQYRSIYETPIKQ